MNKGTKVTVGIGAVMILVGIIVMGLGVGAAAGVGDWRPTDDVFWEGESGTGSFVHVEEGVGSYVLVMVTDDIRCDEFTLEIEGGMASWEQDWCVEDGKLPSGHEDDPEGWLHLGTIKGLEDGEEYTITTSHGVVLVGGEVIEELIGDILGGLAAICGGPTFLCCGLIFLLIGIVMALTQKGNEKTETRIEINQEIDSVKGDKNWYDDGSS
jgi:hypothetical protein